MRVGGGKGVKKKNSIEPLLLKLSCFPLRGDISISCLLLTVLLERWSE